jgi:hypothetical protein
VRLQSLPGGVTPATSDLWGVGAVQTTQPRDLGALVLVVGFILILFLVTVALGPSGH